MSDAADIASASLSGTSRHHNALDNVVSPAMWHEAGVVRNQKPRYSWQSWRHSEKLFVHLFELSYACHDARAAVCGQDGSTRLSLFGMMPRMLPKCPGRPDASHFR